MWYAIYNPGGCYAPTRNGTVYEFASKARRGVWLAANEYNAGGIRVAYAVPKENQLVRNYLASLKASEPQQLTL